MYRGTTPTNIFILPEEMNDASFDTLYITYQQRNKTVLEKTLDNIQRDGNVLTVKLTQAETLAFESGHCFSGAIDSSDVYIQIRAKLTDGTAMASELMKASVQQILKDGEI